MYEDGLGRSGNDGIPGAVRDVEALMTGLVSALGGVEVGLLDGDALMGTVLALEGIQRRLDAVKAVMIGRLDSLGVTETETGLSTKRWKAHRTHSSDTTVGRELKIARTLQRFGSFAEALAAGVVSVDHVLALAGVCNNRITDALIEVQDDLVRFARYHRFSIFVTHLRQVAAVLDADGVEPDCGDRDTAAMGRDYEGHLHVSLELSGHSAAEIEAIINTETDRQYRAAVREHDTTGVPIPPMGVLRARAVVELVRRGANPNSAKPVVSVNVTITADRDGNPTRVHTPDGTNLDAVTAAVLICEAHLQPVTVDSSGNPLNLGRTVRLFTPAQKQALIVRDGGCVFPGCDQPASRCDAHHETPWNQGGRTDIDHGVLLCRRHHGLMHCHRPWILLHYDIADLPAHLADTHHQRAASANLDPTTQVRVFRDPNGKLLLAQNTTDHQGPAPP